MSYTIPWAGSSSGDWSSPELVELTANTNIVKRMTRRHTSTSCLPQLVTSYSLDDDALHRLFTKPSILGNNDSDR